VVRDIPTRFDPAPYPLGPELNIAVVATFAPDEPLEEVVAYEMKNLRGIPNTPNTQPNR
jgi:hypothetical protein